MNASIATAADVVRALRVVIDPDLHIDIVEAGFVHDVEVVDGIARFTIRLTTPACPAKATIAAEATAAVRALYGIRDVDITMDAQRRRDAELHAELRASLGRVRHIIAVVSGKGGVGKSSTTVHVGAALTALGARVGLLDADIHGPSLMQMTGAEAPVVQPDQLWTPPRAHDMSVVSMAMFMRRRQAAIMRGPKVAHALRQLITCFDWGELDYLLVDLPPGTGDVHLRLAELMPLTGAVVVTTPQEMSVLDCRRAIAMLHRLRVEVLGVVENMAGYTCPSCDDLHPLFPPGGGQRLADEYEVPLLGSVPFDPRIAVGCDVAELTGARHFDALAGAIAARTSTLTWRDAT